MATVCVTLISLSIRAVVNFDLISNFRKNGKRRTKNTPMGTFYRDSLEQPSRGLKFVSENSRWFSEAREREAVARHLLLFTSRRTSSLSTSCTGKACCFEATFEFLSRLACKTTHTESVQWWKGS